MTGVHSGLAVFVYKSFHRFLQQELLERVICHGVLS